MARLPEGMKLRYFGHSGIFFQTPGGLKVLVDPWLEHPKAPEGLKDEVIDQGADVIFLTHGHADHIGNTVEVAKATKATVVSIFEVMLWLSGQGLDEDNLVGMNKGGTHRIKDLRATMVNATHSSGINMDDEVTPGGEAAGYMFRLDNDYTIYHAGDTGLFGGIKELGAFFKPNLALIPIGDLFTLGPELAAYFTRQLGPDHIIPIHWGTFPALTGTPDAFEDQLGDWGDRQVTLQPGETME